MSSIFHPSWYLWAEIKDQISVIIYGMCAREMWGQNDYVSPQNRLSEWILKLIRSKIRVGADARNMYVVRYVRATWHQDRNTTREIEKPTSLFMFLCHMVRGRGEKSVFRRMYTLQHSMLSVQFVVFLAFFLYARVLSSSSLVYAIFSLSPQVLTYYSENVVIFISKWLTHAQWLLVASCYVVYTTITNFYKETKQIVLRSVNICQGS